MMHAPAPALDLATITFLNAATLGAAAHGFVPDERPAKFIRVITAGGQGRFARALYRGLVIVESWGNNQKVASELASAVDAAMFDMADTGPVSRVTSAGAIAFLPDPLSGQARYTATYEIITRAV